MPAAADYRSLVKLIDLLYAGALDPAEWPKFLAAVASTFDAQNAFICQLRDRRDPVQYISLSDKNRDALPVASYPSLIDHDPRAHVFNTVVGRPVHCGMGLTRETLRTSRAYREYLQPLDFEHTMVVVFPTDAAAASRNGLPKSPATRVTHDLGIIRGSSGKAFDASDCDLLSEIAPHIQRAFTIQRALEAKNAPPAPPLAPVATPSSESILIERFSLSPAQARTTVLLMAGQSVKEIAIALEIEENSVRQYLKRIFQRTGTQRQADLVRVAIRACDGPETARQD